MKVYHKYAVGAYSGTIDDSVFYATKTRTRSIMRRWVMPRLTVNNTLLGAIGANLAVLWSDGSATYKADLKTYTERYFGETPSEDGFDGNRSPYANWVRLMYAWADDNPSVDLKTLTSADLGISGSAVSTVKNAIDNGYLAPISNYADLTGAF